MAKILIIDDDFNSTLLLESMLKINNHQPSSVTNSMNAVEVASSTLPELILLDIMMPGINGIQLCKIFQSTPTLKHIPIIMVSALDDIGSKKDAFNAGAKGFIVKPVYPKDLASKIKEFIPTTEQPNQQS